MREKSSVDGCLYSERERSSGKRWREIRRGVRIGANVGFDRRRD
jgi:hypothetical protein